jgi:hypothetical protein
MAQFQQRWHSGTAQRSWGERAWLSMLIDTFEIASRDDVHATPCDPWVVLAAKAHLAHPACFSGSDLARLN